jgi:hypothetical protein
MRNAWRLGLIGALLLGPVPAIAADPAINIASQMDRYAQNPRGPSTYRALARLGDPNFVPESSSSSDGVSPWDEQNNARNLFDVGWGECRTDYAMKTYRARVAQLGAGHRYVDQWLRVQRAVFSACKGYGAERRVEPLPPPLALGDPELDRLQRADRAYQAASQLFYRERIPEARAAFAAIAAQRGPHQATAAYMVAAIDAGSRADQFQPVVPRPGAIAEARALMTYPRTAGMRIDGHELIGWMGYNADTRETRAAQVAVTLDALHLPLATIESDSQARARYDRSAEDLQSLFSKFPNDDWWLTGAIPNGYFGSLAMANAAKTDRLAAYSLVPACGEAKCDQTPLAVIEFVQNRVADADKADDRDAWRAAEFELADPFPAQNHWAEIDRLIGLVQRAPTDHDVALLTLLASEQLRRAFERDRWDTDAWRDDRRRAITLMARWPWPEAQWFANRYVQGLRSAAGGGRLAEARALRDQVGSRIVAVNRWTVPGDLMLLLAEDRDHFVEAMVNFGTAASPLVDRLPVRELTILAQDFRIAQRDRARFARIAWTRAWLLERRMPKELDRVMRSLNAELNWHSKIGARTDDHALLLDLLRTPAMNLRAASRSDTTYDGSEVLRLSEIDTYQHSLNNWWCGPLAVDFNEREESALSDALGSEASRPAAERMLAESWVWQALDRNERMALAAHPMAPRIMAELAVAWGRKANPRRPDGADEALALAVRATRYGCQFQGGHGPWSKAAWDTLHQRFPDTDAARRTRWWFDCKHFTYGCTDSTKDDQSYVPWSDETPAEDATKN